MKKALAAAAVALLLAAAGVGAVVVMKKRAADRADERASLATAFANTSQCFFGASVGREEISFRRLATISARLDGLDTRWPFQCTSKVDAFRARLDDSVGLDPALADRLRTALYKLNVALEDDALQLVRLAELLSEVWSAAGTLQIAFGEPSADGEPYGLPLSSDPSRARLPLAGFLPLRGGPTWSFLAWPADDHTIAKCEPRAGALLCKLLDVPADKARELRGATAFGTWSSPDFILVRSRSGAVDLLHGTTLEPIMTVASDRSRANAHVDAEGVVTSLAAAKSDVKPTQMIMRRARGAPEQRVKLVDALRKVDPTLVEDMSEVALLGPRLVIERRSGELVRLDIDSDGWLIAPVEVAAADKDRGPLSTCRAGEHDILAAGSSLFIQVGSVLHKLDGELAACRASGIFTTTDGATCTAAGCVRERMRGARINHGINSSLPKSGPQSVGDRVGDAEVIAWVGRMDSGLLARATTDRAVTTIELADSAEKKPASVTDILNGDVDPGQFGVYGRPEGGVVLFEDGRGFVVGAWVSPEGEFTPLRVEGL